MPLDLAGPLLDPLVVVVVVVAASHGQLEVHLNDQPVVGRRGVLRVGEGELRGLGGHGGPGVAGLEEADRLVPVTDADPGGSVDETMGGVHRQGPGLVQPRGPVHGVVLGDRPGVGAIPGVPGGSPAWRWGPGDIPGEVGGQRVAALIIIRGRVSLHPAVGRFSLVEVPILISRRRGRDVLPGALGLDQLPMARRLSLGGRGAQRQEDQAQTREQEKDRPEPTPPSNAPQAEVQGTSAGAGGARALRRALVTRGQTHPDSHRTAPFPVVSSRRGLPEAPHSPPQGLALRREDSSRGGLGVWGVPGGRHEFDTKGERFPGGGQGVWGCPAGHLPAPLRATGRVRRARWRGCRA